MSSLSRRTLLTAATVAVLGSCKTTTSYQASAEANSGTAPTEDSTPPKERVVITSVAMVGDSITEGSADELRELFADEGLDDVEIDGEASRRVLVGSGPDGVSGVRAVEALLDDGADPSVWVIALGTNDVGNLGTPLRATELISEILDLLPGSVPVVWVNVYRPGELGETSLFNEALEGVLEQRGNSVVADWYSIATDPDRDVLRSDDLHPNDEGQLVFAELVVQALQRL